MRNLFFLVLCACVVAGAKDGTRNELITISAGASHDFNFVTPPADDTDTFTLTNTSNYIVTDIRGEGLASPFQYEGGSFPGTSGTCGDSLAPGANCTFAITFDPVNTSAVNDTAEIVYQYSTYPGVEIRSYMTVIGNTDPCGLAPTITDVSPGLANTNTTRTFTVTGSNFEVLSEVQVPGQTVDSTTFVSTTQLQFQLTVDASTGFYDVQVSNSCGNATDSNAIEVKSLPWVDLRTGGDTTASLGMAMSGGLAMTRDASGMYFTGTGGWGSWVQYQNHSFTRGVADALEIVFLKNSSATFMMGIGSDAQNFGSTTQWREVENCMYTFTNTIWGYYGNNGTPGNLWNQAISAGTTITYGNTYKVRFDDDGATGSALTVYEVDAANWDSILSTVNGSISTNPADEANLEVTVIPAQVGTAWRIVAFRVEQ